MEKSFKKVNYNRFAQLNHGMIRRKCINISSKDNKFEFSIGGFRKESRSGETLIKETWSDKHATVAYTVDLC